MVAEVAAPDQVRAEVAEKKAMPRLGGGLVTFNVDVLNQRSESVQSGTWKLLVKLPGTPYSTLTPIPSPTLPVTDTPLPTHTFTPRPSRTPTPTEQVSPTPAATEQAPASGTDWTRRLGVALLVMAGFGLGLWVGQVRADRKRRTP